MELNKRLVVYLLVVITLPALGQDRYLVFFKDKVGTPFTINNPEAFLSQASIARRTNQNIDVIEEDLPVNPAYVQQVKNTGVNTFHRSRWFNAVLVQGDEAQIEAIRALEVVDHVQFMAPDVKLKNNGRRGSVNKFMQQNGQQGVQSAQQLNFIGANNLQNEELKGQGVTIAVMDGGYRGVNSASAFQHLYNENLLLDTYDFVENDDDPIDQGPAVNDHGTKVLSVMAGLATGFFGIAPQANYLIYATEDVDEEYRIEEYNWIFAAERADSIGADIINTSLGYGFYYEADSMNYSRDMLDGNSIPISIGAQKAASKGMLVVTAVGNEGTVGIDSPADADNTLAVGGVDADGVRWSFSATGPTADDRIKPDAMSLGNTAAISQSGNAVSVLGTSFSSPLIAGLAALIWQKNPEWTSLELLDYIRNLGDRSSTPDNTYGYGVVRYGSIQSIFNDQFEKLKVYPNPVTNQQITIDGIKSNTRLRVKLSDLNGKVIMNNEYTSSANQLDIILPQLPKGMYIFELQSKTVRFNEILRIE